MASNSTQPASRLTGVQWAICVMAAIGFAFDIYELLMLPLIARPALMELGGFAPGSPGFVRWTGLLFYVPAVCGGIFGLLGGYLTDSLGRRRVLTWSIMLYAVSAFAAGFSTSLYMLLVLRCLTFVGVCVEFVAATAWLAELFDDRAQRERVLGYTQAFSSVGGLLVAIASGFIVKHSADWPALSAAWVPWIGTIKDPNAAWRYTLMSGLLPALPLLLIRPWLPESPKWKQRKEAGTLRRPSFAAIFSPELRRTTIVTTIMVAMSYGAAFGSIQMLRDIVPRLPEVKAETAGKPVPKQKQIEQIAIANYTKVQEVGGLAGRFLLALLVVAILSRRKLLRMFQVPGLIAMPLIFYAFATAEHNRILFSIPLEWMFLEAIEITPLHLGIFVAGLLTVAQFSFWGNYLPQAYPVHLRGTGESFAANVGGRMIGTSFAAITPLLGAVLPAGEASAETRVAYAAAIIGFSVYLVGLIGSYFLPEPTHGGEGH
jgi:MFS family permease